jgi:hypothetical protein
MSSAQVQISQLPAAGAITGAELVPIVQNGQTVQTTTGAISASPSQTQTFLTLNLEASLPNSRFLSSGTGVGLVDGGAQSFYRITLNGVSGTLETMGNGFGVNIGGTMTARSMAVSGAGLSIADGDGQSGNPTLSLAGIVASLASSGGTGFLALPGNGTVSGRTLTGTANQIGITNPNGIAGNPTFSIADNPVFPGTGGAVFPTGNTAARPASPTNGTLRYNSQTSALEAYVASGWGSILSQANIGLGPTQIPQNQDLGDLAYQDAANLNLDVNIIGNLSVSGTTFSRVVVYADATSISINADTTDIATQANTQAAGTLTINAPSGTPTNGQKLILRVRSTNIQTLSWNAIFQGSADIALPPATSGGDLFDYVGFLYNSTTAKWQMVAKVFGF